MQGAFSRWPRLSSGIEIEDGAERADAMKERVILLVRWGA